MKINNFFEVLDRYFLDFIGTVIPGMAFILGVYLLFKQPLFSGTTLVIPLNNVSSWIFCIITGYVLGHAINSIGENIIIKFLEYIKIFKITSRLVPGFIKPKKELFEESKKRIDYKQVVNRATKYLSLELKEKNNFSFWRSIAMSFAEDNSLVYRFRFLSLMNLGIASSILLINIVWILLIFINGRFDFTFNLVKFNWIIFVALFLASLPFLERYYQFFRYSMEVPFSMALLKLRELEETKDRSNLGISLPNNIDSLPVVYLAGGFRSNWQDKIKIISGFNFLDPRVHNLKNESQYTIWDLEAIHQSDILFAYLEEKNPGCYALSLEIGYAKALGKRIILVDEKSSSNEECSRYLGMVKASADITFSSLEDGLKFMNSLSLTSTHKARQ